MHAAVMLSLVRRGRPTVKVAIGPILGASRPRVITPAGLTLRRRAPVVSSRRDEAAISLEARRGRGVVALLHLATRRPAFGTSRSLDFSLCCATGTGARRF